jgi:hypothetical protein
MRTQSCAISSEPVPCNPACHALRHGSEREERQEKRRKRDGSVDHVSHLVPVETHLEAADIGGSIMGTEAFRFEFQKSATQTSVCSLLRWRNYI